MEANESIQGILGGVKECIQGVMKAKECILRVMGGQEIYTRSNGRSRNIYKE